MGNAIKEPMFILVDEPECAEAISVEDLFTYEYERFWMRREVTEED